MPQGGGMMAMGKNEDCTWTRQGLSGMPVNAHSMPGMTGGSLTASLSSLRPSSWVIIVSGDDDGTTGSKFQALDPPRAARHACLHSKAVSRFDNGSKETWFDWRLKFECVWDTNHVETTCIQTAPRWTCSKFGRVSKYRYQKGR
jgi:hypothetical protein